MSLTDKIKSIIDESPSQDRTRRAFEIHNENFKPRYTNRSCGGCVRIVFNRLKNYVETGK